MTIRTGADLVDVDRVQQLVINGGEAFLDQGWTTREQLYCAGDAQRLATRWAAKEAVMKALGTGYPDIEHRDIEVLSTDGEPPQVSLTGSAARIAADLQLSEWSLTLTHEKGLAMAVVVAAGGTP